MSKRSKVNRMYLLIIVITITLSLFCVIVNSDDRYSLIWLLPTIMSILLILFHNTVYETRQFLSFRIIVLVEYLRYVIIPVFMVASNFYDSTYYAKASSDAVNIAIYLMCYELIIEFVIMYFIMQKIKKISTIYGIEKEKVIRYGWLLIISVLLIVFVIYRCYANNLTIRLSFFMFSLPATSNIFIGGENYLQCAFSLIYFVVALPLLRRFKTSTPPILKFVILSALWIGVSFGNARMMYIVKALTVIYLVFVFAPPKIGKKLAVILFSAALVSIMLMTLWDDNASHGLFYFTGSTSEKSTYAYTLQKYFSGPYNVAKAIEVEQVANLESFSTRMQQFWIDITGNIYPLYNYSTMDTTKVLFNYHLYGSYEKATQIIPIVGQGYIYFGFIFSFIPTALVLFILEKIEIKKCKLGVGNSIMSFFIMYASIYLAFFRMYNVIIISGFMVNVILYGFVFCVIQDKVKIRGR